MKLEFAVYHLDAHLGEQTFYRGPPSDSEGAPVQRSGREVRMWLGLAILFLVIWLIAFLAFHVVVAAIHILLALFVIFLIVHFVRRAARHA